MKKHIVRLKVLTMCFCYIYLYNLSFIKYKLYFLGLAILRQFPLLFLYNFKIEIVAFVLREISANPLDLHFLACSEVKTGITTAKLNRYSHHHRRQRCHNHHRHHHRYYNQSYTNFLDHSLNYNMNLNKMIHNNYNWIQH